MDDPKSMVSPCNDTDWHYSNRCLSPMQSSKYDELQSCRKSGGTHDSAFSGILALQLIEMTKKLESTSSDKFLPEVRHQAYVNLSEREYGCKALRL